MSRIGVFICHCGINISSTVDTEKIRRFSGELDDVVVSKDYIYLCSDAGAKLIKETVKENNLDTIVIASCSPKMHEHTFRSVVEEEGVNPYKMEVANIREQCSWSHADKEKATQKAKSLIAGAVAKARLLKPLKKQKVAVVPQALVIGGGIAGIQASLDIAEAGFKVFLVEKTPSIGGRMAQLDKTYPTLDCSACILTPKMMDVANHPNITLLSYARVTSIQGSIGNYTVTITKKPRYVDVEKCTGCGVCAEACRLKGKIENEFDMDMEKRAAVYIPFPQAVPLKYTIDDQTCLYLTKGKCGSSPACLDACAQKAIDFTQKPEIMEINVGAILVATGYDLLDPSTVHEYGYSRSKDIITNLEFERMLSASGPTQGNILRLSTGEKPQSVTFVLCVGSRDETHCTYCCRIGCMSSLKQAYLLREKMGQDIEVNICYTDIRSFGKGYEEFYRKLRGMDINFFRGRPSDIRPFADGIVMDIFDTITNKLYEISTEMIVLIPSLIPRTDTLDLARLLNISASSDGFLLEAHPKLKPMDASTDGIFLAGCCQGPKDIPDTVAQASGAAARAANILSKKELEVEPIYVEVDKDLCSGCEVCVSVCPYGAIDLETDPDNSEKQIAVVNKPLCKGCGLCSAACPSGAMQQLGYKDDQLVAIIDAYLD
jgi:heterodisulfide reductase subunit A